VRLSGRSRRVVAALGRSRVLAIANLRPESAGARRHTATASFRLARSRGARGR